jgi:hypothetical protein
MSKKLSNVDRPWWVSLALWGLSSRGSAWSFVLLSIGLAIACVVYGFWDRRFSVGVLFIFAAFWYLRAIRWVDQHGGWT